MNDGGILSMGGYAGFVWPAYGIAALLLVAMALASLLRLAHVRRALARLESAATPNGTGSPP